MRGGYVFAIGFLGNQNPWSSIDSDCQGLGDFAFTEYSICSVVFHKQKTFLDFASNRIAKTSSRNIFISVVSKLIKRNLVRIHVFRVVSFGSPEKSSR